MQVDYVVVGSGTAGSVLAEKLSASGANQVLVIEAGAHGPGPLGQMPAGFTRLFRSSRDWNFETTPQKAARDRIVYVPRGRMLGGSSNMNAQIHQWGHPEDYDGWKQGGAVGWGWADVAPVFANQERMVGGGPARGACGPMAVEENAFVHPAACDFVAAARETTAHSGDDYNGGAFEGAWLSQVANRGGRRFSAYDAYLKPALQRANVMLLTEALVVRVEMEGGVATGVTVRENGHDWKVQARQGVVLAAGALGSPQILMRSGIGPAMELIRIGQPVVRHSPGVGRNLHDHPMAILCFPTRRAWTYRSAGGPRDLLRYLFRRSGPLASNVAEAIAFRRSDPSLTAPDLELIFAPVEWRNQALDAPRDHALTLGAALVAPLSRGVLRLNDDAPDAKPVIDFNLLGHPRDRQAILAAARWALEVAASRPLAQHLAPLRAELPDEELFEVICRDLQTVYHPAGTCRMGMDDQAVVDPQLRVRGAERLWVADASVMPALPRGHPNAAVAMIAAKAADLIQASSGRSPFG